MHTLLSGLELAGLVFAEQRADGSIIITVQAGLIDPRNDVAEARRKSKPSNVLGKTQRVVFNAIVLEGIRTCDGVYKYAIPRLEAPATKRDRRAECVQRALRRLHARGFIVISAGMVEPGEKAEAAE